ncbi:PLP-dependent aminotransferase family protein [Archangium sp.]|uniref:aminotransferase-like domain-containing protein n=1 Tax=Archangium sp. TaxID=1872627 RepID=UPI002D50A30C|nr:PLP-dependent aminotransferase family protein [Archangium sp.]HYO51307.1 PLP-dependent aminotransferase family protein [Archangium sp.]
MTATTQQDSFQLARWLRDAQPEALRELLAEAGGSQVLTFALGLPPTECFPQEAFARATAELFRRDPEALQLGAPYQPIKRHIVELMRQRGVECTEEEVFLTSGAQQALGLAAGLFLETGGRVLLEETSYLGFHHVIKPRSPQFVTVPTNLDDGIDLDAVEAVLSKGERPALMYAMSDGHNPLGISLSPAKRTRLAEMARNYRVPLIEDDPYGFLLYDEVQPPPMRAQEKRWVFYAGSLSKVLSPSLRLGWLLVPPELTSRLSILRQSMDIDSSNLAQKAATVYLESGHLTTHLTALRRELKARRDAMLSALERHFPAGCRWSRPSSGVFVWVELPKHVNTLELLRVSLREEKVVFVPGSEFWCGKDPSGGRNCMRLSFSNLAPAQIEEGIGRLARALKKIG